MVARQERYSIGSYRVAAYSRPYGTSQRGGDRHELALDPYGRLFFALADAPGHGLRGEAFWKILSPGFRACWSELVQAEAPEPEEALRDFVERLNRLLFQESSRLSAQSQPNLCLVAGCLDLAGTLAFVSCGFGTHAVPVVGDTSLSPPDSFGLRLGWVSPSHWRETPRAIVFRRVQEVSRLILLSDGFLGDDHRDPLGALALVRGIAEQCERCELSETVARIQETPHDGDDATFIALELAASRSQPKAGTSET